MPFTEMPEKERGHSVSFRDVSRLALNQQHNFRTLVAEHTLAGAHNTLRVPRGIAFVEWDGAAYAINETMSLGFSAVARQAAGHVRLTLDATFASTPLVVRCNSTDDTGETDPWIITHNRVNSTTLDVYLWKGPSWALTDGEFCIAVHSQPVDFDDSSFHRVAGKQLGTGFDYLTFNKLAENAARLHKGRTARHSEEGAHNCVEVARALGRVVYDPIGLVPELEDNGDAVIGVSEAAPGLIEVELDEGYVPFSAKDVAIFGRIGNPLDLTQEWNIVFPQSMMTESSGWLVSFVAATRVRNGTAWDLDSNGCFGFSIHGAGI
jgi:hypothetical protein